MLVNCDTKPLIALVALFLAGFSFGCGSSSGTGVAKAETISGGGSGGGAVSGSPAAMSAGDVVLVDFSSGSASISFSGASSGSSYELLLQSQATDATSRSFGVASLNAAGKSLGLADPIDDSKLSQSPNSVQDRFEGVLRDEERLLINAPWSEGASKAVSVSKSSGGGSSPSVSTALSVGNQGSFRVLTSLSDVTQYANITATVKCVNDTVAIYLDDEIASTNPGDLPQSDIDSLCTKYKTSLTTVKNTFGSYPDLNGDGIAVALITPQVNRLGASGGGIVTGFFYAGDLFARSGSIPASNYREIVYLLTPDSGGVYGTKVTNAFAMSNFLPAVFPHEMQHLISYYQHTIVRSGNAEEDWLNEALSHFTEDLVGYGRENYSRYSLFLASPQSYSVVTSGSPSLAQRGAGYLFLRFLYEQSGNSTTFLSQLDQTTKTGATNLVQAFPATSTDFDELGEFLRRWAIALAYTNRGLTTNSKFVYQARTLNDTTGNYQGVCLVCTANDGRGTILDGLTYGSYSAKTNYSVVGTATRFLKISSPPDSLSISVSNSATPSAIVLRSK